jgi:hypothetical protein
MVNRRAFRPPPIELLEPRIVLSASAGAGAHAAAPIAARADAPWPSRPSDPPVQESPGVHADPSATLTKAAISATPGDLVTVPGKFNVNATTVVQLKDRSGRRTLMTLTPDSVTSSTVTVAIPFYVTPKTGNVGSGVVRIKVMQDGVNRSRGAHLLEIAGPAQTGQPPGAVILNYLTGMQGVLSSAIADYTALEGTLGYGGNLGLLVAGLQNMQSQFTSFQQTVASVADGQVPQIDLGSTGGHDAVLNSSSLSLMDQMLTTFARGGAGQASPAAVTRATVGLGLLGQVANWGGFLPGSSVGNFESSVKSLGVESGIIAFMIAVGKGATIGGAVATGGLVGVGIVVLGLAVAAPVLAQYGYLSDGVQSTTLMQATDAVRNSPIFKNLQNFFAKLPGLAYAPTPTAANDVKTVANEDVTYGDMYTNGNNQSVADQMLAKLDQLGAGHPGAPTSPTPTPTPPATDSIIGTYAGTYAGDGNILGGPRQPISGTVTLQITSADDSDDSFTGTATFTIGGQMFSNSVKGYYNQFGADARNDNVSLQSTDLYSTSSISLTGTLNSGVIDVNSMSMGGSPSSDIGAQGSGLLDLQSLQLTKQ